jgi:hypothetical protein
VRRRTTIISTVSIFAGCSSLTSGDCAPAPPPALDIQVVHSRTGASLASIAAITIRRPDDHPPVELTGPLQGVGSPLGVAFLGAGTYDVIARAEGYESDSIRVVVRDDVDKCPSTITEHVQLRLAPLP